MILPLEQLRRGAREGEEECCGRGGADCGGASPAPHAAAAAVCHVRYWVSEIV